MLDALWFNPNEMLIGGTWKTAVSNLPLFNPSDGSLLAEIANGSAINIDEAVTAAQVARNGKWGQLSATERGRILTKIGQKVLERVDDLAEIEAYDVGKPLAQARADAVALARYMEFYGGAADKLMG